MNLNVRVKGQHVDFEEKTYYASFSGELEASASPMWALVSHLKDSNTREYTVNVLKHCLTAIREWMEDVEFDSQDKVRFSLLFKLILYLELRRCSRQQA
jgi:E3 ubiquitin-protein ligase UBR3